MPDSIPKLFSEIESRYDTSRKILENIVSQHDLLLAFAEEIKVRNKNFKLNLENIEKLIKNDEKTVLCERLLYQRYVNYFSAADYETKQKYMENLLDAELQALEITAGYTEEGWVYVRSPGFLPTEKDVWLSRGFFNPIETKLSSMNPEKKFFEEKCFIVTVQNIKEGDVCQTRDADNREYKNLNNMLARNFLYDDNPECCDFLFASLYKDYSCVEAFIIPMKDMPEFLKRLGNKDITPKNLQEKP